MFGAQDQREYLIALQTPNAHFVPAPVQAIKKREFFVSKQIVLVYAVALTLLTSGGLVFGFGPLYNELVEEEQWSDQCVHSKKQLGVTCPEQETQLQMVYSTAFLCLDASCAVFGLFCDVFGPKLTVMTALTISAVGNFLLAYGDNQMIIAGYAAVSAGGMGSYVATLQLLHLFESRALVYSIMPSIFNCSGYVYMLLLIDGVTRQRFFQLYGVLVVMLTIFSLLTFPYEKIEKPSDYYRIKPLSLRLFRMKKPAGLMQSLRRQLHREDLWFFAALFGWNSLIFAFTGGAIPNILLRFTENNPDVEDKASVYLNYLFPLIGNGTFVFSPLIGLIISKLGFRPIFFLALGSTQCFLCTLLVPNLDFQIVSLVLYAIGQATTYSLHEAYIFICFPSRVTGSIVGFTTGISFGLGLLTYILNFWTQQAVGGEYFYPFLVLLLPTIFLYFFIKTAVRTEQEGKLLAMQETFPC